MNREEAARYFARQRDTLIWGLADSRNETRQAHDAYNAALYEELKARASERVDTAPGFDSIRPEGKVHD